MKLRSKLLATAGVLAVAGLGVFAGSSIGGGSTEVASSVDASYDDTVTVKPKDLKLTDSKKVALSGAEASRKKAKVFWYTTAAVFQTGPGGATLVEIICPAKQQVTTGGIFGPTPGLAISNSSRSNPIGQTLGGAWYEGVVNFTNGSINFQATVTCIAA